MFKNGIIVILFSAFAMADAPISGQVFSSNGQPLAYAVISDGDNWVIADENGQFNYFYADTGDTLSISRYGYVTEELIISESSFYSITLEPLPIRQKDIIVSGKEYNFNGQIVNSYRENVGIDSPQNVFQQIPGLSIRSYGGKAGIMNLSTNGSPTVNTKILLDDIDLTSAQNGETDLSQIPETFVNNVSVATSPGIFYGSGAVDGVIRILPLINTSSLFISSGSFGFGSFSGNISKSFNKWSANLSAGYLKDDGNFKYSTEDSSTTRLNNDFERKYVALNSTVRFSDKSNIKALLIESRQERGVAGSTDWVSPEARRDDKLRLAALTFNRLHSNGYSKVQINYRKSLENYNDPNPWWPINSEHDVLGTSLKLQHHCNILKDITGTFLYEGKLEKLESTDVGIRERKTNSIASNITIPIGDSLNVIPALRFDRTGSDQFQPTMDLRLLYNKMRKSEIEYHYSTGFRYPTFNDMYWQPGGNPNLEPEKSWYIVLKYKFYLNDNYLNNIYFNIADRHTDNLIQWIPIDETFFIWQPRNIARSHRTNFTIGSQYNLEKLPLQIAMHATYQKTNDIDLDKPLLHAPEIIGFAGMNYTINALNIALSAHYTGERITAYPNFSNPDDTMLPSYVQTTATLQYQLPLLGNQFSIMLDVNNILDKQFESISGYPEPGRNFRIGIKYFISNN